ncbi:ATPase family associated with various cellular activities (AAA) [Lentzea waywayandensis]|uniref:ATPase family associated with various cellular activities (AAA) n=1 Tax=Lentzea waywayandensis TaxID=84724 RepID=A0A1I6CQT5_9PSEU|nr:AAA family ATPase [Lentzea waywayandensis]SFQ95499.1 ATPase family associated with various cellular activities (AAA) [Lentzea waywayandensis]
MFETEVDTPTWRMESRLKVQECVLSDEVVDADSTEGELWDAIVTPASVKERLRNQTLLSLLVRPSLPFTVTALHGLCTLYGPPGTGKTTLARGLPAQVARYVPGRKARRIEINPHGLMSAEHGQSQQRVSELLGEYVPGLAEDGMPTVVILDEVESMAVARSAASLSANPADVHRATDAVLTALDHNAVAHPHLFFVATSNFTSALDDAFLSRSDAAILVPLPEPEALREILAGTLLALVDAYPRLGELAASPAIGRIAEAARGLDGRRARKAVFEAMAQRLETVLDPESLTEHDLSLAVRNAVAETTK